jgi:acetyl coenzyme A synthetase (ADP forming)-like protein
MAIAEAEPDPTAERATTSLRPLFRPQSVAIVGASRRPASLGRRVLDALVANGYRGRVYPINAAASSVAGLTAYHSVRDVPEPIDLAIIAIPREGVLEAIDDCAARETRALIVITAGFAESDAEGRALQQHLLDRVRAYGMRMVGPNCMGILNTDPEIRLNASFSPVFPPAGSVALSSQSGALGLAILALARQRQLGLSSFVSVGNKADVSGNDLLLYWEADPLTSVILLYLESFGNPRRFARIARRISRRKPIVAVKAGRTRGGTRAAGSHTAALAASDVAVDALFRQTGVIRADTLEEMFDLAACLSTQPLPSGRRVGIVTNAGGPGILCVDACESAGLSVPVLSPATRARLAEFLPPVASMTNPVDMIASAGPDQYRRAVETLLAAPDVNALVVIHTPIDRETSLAVAGAIRDGIAAGRTGGGERKPVVACLLAEDTGAAPLVLERERVPTYAFPEIAARVLSKAAVYADWRAEPEGVIPRFDDADTAAARAVCLRALAREDAGWLSAEDVRAMLSAYRLPVAPGGVARTSGEAAALARALGFPVAVKLVSHEIVHKTEAGGVRLDLEDEDAVREAFEQIRTRLATDHRLGAMDGVLVQPMFAGGVEVMVGVTEDPLFGPLVGFGLGGIHVEILGDVQFRVSPITDRDATRMIEGIRGYRLLQGYRGHPPGDVDAIRDVLLRVSRLVEDLPEIAELDLNPIIALAPGSGCRIVDARIRVAAPRRD